MVIWAFLWNRCRRLEGHLLQVRHKKDWSPRVYPFITLAAVLVRSDAVSDGVFEASRVPPIIRPLRGADTRSYKIV